MSDELTTAWLLTTPLWLACCYSCYRYGKAKGRTDALSDELDRRLD
jgi:hypothetical protein